MGSLDGLKVLDFSTLLPGPYATLMLADMGAEVLKVSSASKPDIVLDYPPYIGDTGISACQAWLGRNKKTMFLNLKTEEGKAIVKELVKEYYNIAPTIVNRIGRQENPEAIYEEIWDSWLSDCVHLIEQGENEACQEKYMDMVYELKERYMA